MLRRDPHEAAMSPKFFMYSPLLPYLINIARAVYEALSHPLQLNVPGDEIIYMVMGRAISAAIGTATILVAYVIGARLSGRLGGLLAAFFLPARCCTSAITFCHHRHPDDLLLHPDLVVRHAHSRARRHELADWRRDRVRRAILSKYSGGFVLGIVGLAYLLSPQRPKTLKPSRHGSCGWCVCDPDRGGLRRVSVTGSARVEVFREVSIRYQRLGDRPAHRRHATGMAAQSPIFQVPSGIGLPIFSGGDLAPCWKCWPDWSGLAASTAGQAGRAAAAFPIAYFIATGHVNTPFVRYAIPMMPHWRLPPAAVGADLLTRPGSKRLAQAGGVGGRHQHWSICAGIYERVSTARQPPSGGPVAVGERPARHGHSDRAVSVVRTGGLLSANTDFGRDYVLWGPPRTNPDRHDYYNLHTIDGYRALYNRGPSDATPKLHRRQAATADWMVIDDQQKQLYEHLPAPDHAVVKQYYRICFREAGNLRSSRRSRSTLRCSAGRSTTMRPS